MGDPKPVGTPARHVRVDAPQRICLAACPYLIFWADGRYSPIFQSQFLHSVEAESLLTSPGLRRCLPQMKSSLAFMGAILVALATGTLLTRAIDINEGASVSHPAPFSNEDRLGIGMPAESVPVVDFVAGSILAEQSSGVFFPNLGQLRHDVYFQFMSSDELAYMRAGSIGIARRTRARPKQGRPGDVNIRFIGANPKPILSAAGRLAKGTSHLDGASDRGLAASMPLFSELTYGGLYDGVDMRLSASGSGLMRTFTLAPGIDPATVLLYYDGADRPELLQSGGLQVSTSADARLYPRPRAHQTVNGVVVALAADYAMRRFGSFGFSVAKYDPSLPLVIEAEGL